MGRRIKDLTARRFGKIFVLHEDGRDNRGNAIWNCLCDCGHLWNVLGYNLVTGATQSCGCDTPSARETEFIDAARNLWNSGLSMTAVGERLGVTRNVIAGIKHRNGGFAARCSPIRGAA